MNAIERAPGPAQGHGGERVAVALAAHGVKWIFTLCGGHISPILVAAKRRGIAIIDVRNEATAVFAADAAARLTGTPGVAAVTAGPGLTNAITALKNAEMAQSPVVLIGGATPTALQGRGALQDIDQRALVAPQVKKLHQVRRVRDLGPAVEDALVTCREGVPGPVFVECPVDLLYDEVLIRQWYADASGKGTAIGDRLLRWYLKRHATQLFAGANAPYEPCVRPVAPSKAPGSQLDAIARALNGARRPLMVVGSQAVVDSLQADALGEAVRKLGIPVYLSGMARGLLGKQHALLMRHARRDALREADLVVLAGLPCDFRLDYGKHVRRSATLVALNRSARDARLNRRPTLTALGDAGDALIRLAATKMVAPAPAEWVATLRVRDDARETDIARQAAARGEFVNPLALLRAVNDIAADDAIFVADGGDFVSTAAYVLHARRRLAWLDPGAFGTLGVGAGFALGARLANPGSEVWLIWGDGASGYGLAEFDTLVRHRIPVIALVGNDAGWTQIAREQVKMLGDDVGTVLSRTAYHEVACGFGAAGIEIRRPEDIPDRLREARALAAGGTPVLVNVWLDKTAFREGSLSM